MGLFVGTDNYTWGRGVYVVGVDEPLSTAIYGRIGVVSRFRGSRWRAFDAREAAHESLYLEWLQSQPSYRDVVLTVHADPLLHRLRNTFREQFGIDVVLFRPDESDIGWAYTRPTDTWLVVSDWRRGRLVDGFSRRFGDARAVVIVEEKFTANERLLRRLPLLSISGPTFAPTVTAAAIRAAYATGTYHRVES